MALKDFIEARAKWRAGILDGSFPSHKEIVGATLDLSSFVGDPTKRLPVITQGVVQQGADLVAGYLRAQDMRDMTHAAYRQAYHDNAAGQEAYEKARLNRFTKGQL